MSVYIASEILDNYTLPALLYTYGIQIWTVIQRHKRHYKQPEEGGKKNIANITSSAHKES